MKISPLTTRIVLVPDAEKKEEVSKSGIILPGDKEKKAIIFGYVSEIGPDVTQVKPGDRVLFNEYGFDPVEANGMNLLIGLEENLLAVIA